MFHLSARYRLLVVALLSWSLLLTACGDTATPTPVATTAIATTVPATTAPAAPASATTAAATSTPVVIATARPTNTAAPTSTTTSAATTTAATTTAAITVPASTTAASTPAAVKAGPGEVQTFSADNAYNHVKALAIEIGIRVAGSENQKKAADYIAKQFEASGLKADFQESSFNFQRDGGSSLTLEGESAAIKLFALYSGPNGSIQNQAELAYLETDPTDLGGVAGKIVLLDVNNRSLSQIIQKLVAAPANTRPLALLIISSEADPLLPPNLRSAALPIAYIGPADGQKLIERSSQGSVKATVNFKVEKSNITIRNVVGTRPAASNSATAPIIVIGGHYDSVPAGPGANDNASGTALTIELARVLAKAYPEVEFRFIAFDGEELGLLGSLDYVKNLTSADKGRMQAMFNLDMVTTGQTLTVAGSKNLADLARTVTVDLGYRDVQVRSTDQPGANSDHFSFSQAKIPVLFFNRQSDPNYHRSSDTPDKFTAKPLDIVGQIMLNTLQKLLS